MEEITPLPFQCGPNVVESSSSPFINYLYIY
jgi:hypothetical protein